MKLALMLGVACVIGCGGQDPPPAAPVPDTVGTAAAQIAATLELELAEAEAALRRGQPAKAVEICAKVLAVDPAMADARVLLASAYLAAGKNTEALKHVNRALLIDDAPVGGWITKAAALLRLGQPAQALSAIQSALKRDPDNRAALINLGQIHAALGDHDARRASLLRRIELDEGDFDARFELAKQHLSEGNAVAAAAAAREIVERNPRHLDGQRLLAALAWDRADYDEALARARFALTLAAEDPGASKLLEAAFYVVTARELTCRHGARPWKAEAVSEVLSELAETGLEGVESFAEYDARFAADVDVQRRIERAARSCKAPRAPTPVAP